MVGFLSAGKAIYQEAHDGISIRGVYHDETEIKHAAQVIADVCFDAKGSCDFQDYVSSIGETGFRPIDVKMPRLKNWQVGEGFAEAYLGGHFQCIFPWPNTRDLKNPKSSLSGADLVGFHNGQFAFGEVKTSAENKSPPQVTSKKGDGLKDQLTKLCHDPDIREVLIQYLFHRVNQSDEFKEAFIAYQKRSDSFSVFGVLVRSARPTIKDWAHVKKHLSVHQPHRVFLIALYLPLADGIEQLCSCVLSKRDAL